MEKTIKIRSSFLSVLNEALQKLKLNDTVKDFTPVIVEADGKFTSVVKTEDDFDPTVFGANIDTEQEDSENDIQKKETREQLLNQAKDAMQQTIDSSSNLKTILDKIKEISKSDDGKWQLNKEHNTASLPARNTYIFKQNNNLCVSHKGKIELFHSVKELREWLKNNHYPLPDDSIVIHESVELDEKRKTFNENPTSDFYGKHGNNDRNWVDLYNTYKNEQITKNQTEYDTNPEIDNEKTMDLLDQGLSKRIPDEIYKADMHKKEEPIISNKYLNFDDEIEECGCGVTSTSSLGSIVQYTANKMKNKKNGIKEALEELKEVFELEEKNFPTFVPEKWRAEKNKDQVEFPCAGKAVEKVISAIQDHPEYIEDVKNGTVQLPFKKDEFWDALNAMYYDYKSTQHENSDLNALAKNFFFKKAKGFLEKYNAGEEIPTSVKEKIDEYIQNGYSLIDIAVPLSGDLYQIFVMNNILEDDDATQWQPINTAIANEFNDIIKNVYGVDSHFKPGDVLYYTTDEETTDTGNTLRKRNKFNDIADIGSKREFAKVAFDGFLNKKNKNGISKRDVFKMLYNALNNPNYKPSFDNNEDPRIADWFDKRKTNKTNPKDYTNFSILTNEEINEIKASWEEKKAEIKQEQPTSEPTPEEIKAEVQQDNELTDKEKKALDMLTMNPNFDISKLTNAQIKEKIAKVMAAAFGESKEESIYESAMKHPWLNKMINRRLVEDDSPADFATGSPISSDMDSTSIDTSSTSTTDTSSVTPDIDIGGNTAPSAPSGFGDVDISVSGYDPESQNDEEGNIPQPNTPEYEIIDVLSNVDNPNDIKIKIKDTKTGEIEIKDLNEI